MDYQICRVAHLHCISNKYSSRLVGTLYMTEEGRRLPYDKNWFFFRSEQFTQDMLNSRQIMMQGCWKNKNKGRVGDEQKFLRCCCSWEVVYTLCNALFRNVVTMHHIYPRVKEGGKNLPNKKETWPGPNENGRNGRKEAKRSSTAVGIESKSEIFRVVWSCWQLAGCTLRYASRMKEKNEPDVIQ